MGETTTYASERARAHVTGLVIAVTCGPVGSMLVDGVRRGEMVLLATALVLASLGCRRARTMRVEAGDDGLLVRNVLRTDRVRWDEIERFERRPVQLLSRWWRDVVCPVAVTRDGRRVTLVAMPVERRPRNAPPRRTKAAAIVDGWDRLLRSPVR